MENASRESPALSRLVGDTKEFLNQVWGQHWSFYPSQIQDQLLTSADIDDLFSTSLLRVPHFRLVKEGRALAPSSYIENTGQHGPTELIAEPAQILQLLSEGVPDTSKISDAIHSGATLIIQGVHRFHPRVREFCHQLTYELAHICQANAYVTPPDAQGLPHHCDPHGTFIIQAFGRKNWMLGEAGNSSLLLLQPGDVLYMPKGVYHSARTDESCISGHLTIGVRATRWQDILKRHAIEVVERLARERELADLPPSWASTIQPAEELSELLIELGKKFGGSRAPEILEKQYRQLKEQISSPINVIPTK
ncbi:cupin superfamily protein [[Mycobacterium] chelonae subsp. bovistauri]|nr:cupin superfamily protein [Mycobacterium sp. QIA-37]